MSKLFPIFILLAFVLAACSSQSTPTPAEPTAAPVEPSQLEPSPTSQQTEPTAPPQQPEPTPTSQQPEGGSAAEVMIFKIIPGESELQYEVGEVFLNQDNRFAVAVGVTKQVEGEITVDPSSPPNSSLGTFTADISQFTSDSDRRDNALRDRFLESATFPTVTFVPTQIEGIPESSPIIET